MPGQYELPITIHSAIKNIQCNKYLLPAIQRKFTWSSTQICVLFDSIMRGYPINTFMFWEVTSQEIRNGFRFYKFLEKYCERFGENNLDFNVNGHGEFFAVIDGQQRLNSLYIGLLGTYAYKLPRKWWPPYLDNDILPPRKLYLNIANTLNKEENEEMMSYEFKFLTNQQVEDDSENPDRIWYEVGNILQLEFDIRGDVISNIIREYLDNNYQQPHVYAQRALERLYWAIRIDKTIHFYKEGDQSIDHVLAIFIRTNHGGTQLTFSDLLMSIAVANWKTEDARSEIDGLVDQVRFSSDMEFSIDRDLILKTSLVICDLNVKFEVTNFTEQKVGKIEKNWKEIKYCIIEVFRLIRSFGLNNASLRSKNAIIPIAYYLFHKGRKNNVSGLYTEINNQAKHPNQRITIRQWLHRSLLKGIFGGQSDALLTSLRKIIFDNLNLTREFPVTEIAMHYRATSKNIDFDSDFVERILRTQKGDSNCFSILALLFPDIDFKRALDIDHLHPSVSFTKSRLDLFFQENQIPNRKFYEDPENWNSIINLHLLDASKNKSKGDTSLEQWLKKPDVPNRNDLLIPENTSLSFDHFEKFIAARLDCLKTKLESITL